MSNATIRKVVLWVAKIAILVLSAPATISVVGEAYHDMPKLFGFVDTLWIIQLAAVVTVESAFLFFFQLVEDRTNLQHREEEEQNAYVYCAWAMYLVLLIIGLIHGEGVAALLVRFSMGLLLFVATNDKLAALRRKIEQDQAKGKKESRKVIQKRNKAEEKIMIALIERSAKEQIQAIDNQSALLVEVSSKKIKDRIFVHYGMEIVDGEVVEENTNNVPQLPEPSISLDLVESTKVQENTEAVESGILFEEGSMLVEDLIEEQKPNEVTSVSFVQQQDQNKIYENDCIIVTKSNDDFVVSCKFCDYREVKLSSSSKDAYKSAVRAGSKHCGKHKEKKSEVSEATFQQ